jgi:hypothetical protein
MMFNMWAAYFVPREYLHEGTVRRHQREVRDIIGKVWTREDETPQQGWMRAYRAGWRVVRVTIQMEQD